MITLLNCTQTGFQHFLRYRITSSIGIGALLLSGLIMGGCISPQTKAGHIEQAPISESQDIPETPAWHVYTIVDKPGRVLGVVVDGKMMVLEVEPKSAAEVAGIQKGDVLQSIDNAAFLEARDDIKSRIGSYSDEDKPLQLTVRRDGKDLVVEVKPLPPPMQIELVDGTPVPLITPVFSPEDYY